MSDTAQVEIEAAYQTASDDPDNAAKVGDLGELYYMASYPLAAAECLKRAATLEPQSFRWWYYLGLAASAAYNADEAAAALRKAVEIDGKYAPALILLADELRRDDSVEAMGYYQRAVELSPQDARAHYGLGECARLKGDDDAAIEHLRKAISLAPKFSAAHGALAALLEDRGQTEEANVHRTIRQEGALPPLINDPLLVELSTKGVGAEEMIKLAERMARAGQVNQAIAILEQAMAKGASELSIRHALGVLFGVEGRFEEAVRQFRVVLQKSPYQIATLIRLADALIRLGHYDEAEQLLREILGTGTVEPEAISLYGDLLLQMGKVEDALRYGQTLIQLQATKAEYHLAMAKALVCNHRYDAAVEEYRKARELKPSATKRPGLFVSQLIMLAVDQRLVASAGATRTLFHPSQLADLADAFDRLGLSEEAEKARNYLDVVLANALHLARRGFFDRAIGVLRVGLLVSPETDKARLLEQIQTAIKSAPKNPRPRHLLALLRLEVEDSEGAADEWRRLMEAFPDFDLAYVAWTVELLRTGKYTQAQDLLRDGLKLSPKSAALANAAAWALSVSPNPAERNGAEAVMWGELASNLSERADPVVLDTLAVAYAAAGKYEQAVKTEQEAMRLATQLGQTGSIPAYRQRLRLFEDGEAYTEKKPAD